jgi:ComF family protein
MPRFLPPTISAALRTLGVHLTDALFPPRCAGCGGFEAKLFCAECAARLRPIKAPLCRVCGDPFDTLSLPAPECANCRATKRNRPPAFDVARSVWEMEGPAREALHALKYQERTVFAEALGGALAELLRTDDVLAHFSPHYIVPIPLHPWRRWRRGYNQSELLAGSLGRCLGVPAIDLLFRTRFTRPQVGLTRDERAVNLRGVFQVDCKKLPEHELLGARILIVDDVYTTGSTIGECARVLKKAGCSEVAAVTVAREV